MARRFELIVFDWDGTLMDSTAAITFALQAAARDVGIEPPSDERARHVIGLGWRESLSYAMPDLQEERYSEVSARYRHHYLVNSQSLYLFAGIADLLQDLGAKGHCLAVATGKSRHGLNDVLARSGLAPLMQASRCADECFSKPHPQMLLELMEETGIASEATLMIGDTTHDMEMANNAGVGAVAVSYGAHGREALLTHRPHICCDTVEELRQWLQMNA